MALSNIMGPAVSAAAITGILTVLVFFRKSSISYITIGRSHWRKEIKSSIVTLVMEWHRNPTSLSVQHALEVIKCHINPYGKMEQVTKNDMEKLKLGDPVVDIYLHDAHIWEAIKSFEHERSQGNLDNLVYYLRLLLKYDWERSKSEVRVNFSYFIAFASVLIGCFTLQQALDVPKDIFVILNVLYCAGIFAPVIFVLILQQRFSKKDLYIGLVSSAIVMLALGALAQLTADNHYMLSFVCALTAFSASLMGCFNGRYGIARQYANNVNKYRYLTRSKDSTSDALESNTST